MTSNDMLVSFKKDYVKYCVTHLSISARLENLLTEVPIKPFFTKPMKRQTVNEGELIIFRVAAKAHPAPGFKWYIHIDFANNIGILFITRNLQSHYG